MENNHYRGGRPTKDETDLSSKRITTRFTQREFDKLETMRQQTQVKDLSTFIRGLCFDKPMRIKPQLSSYQEDVLSLLMEMRSDVLRIGVNVNQSSKRINSTTDYHDLQREVDKMVTEIGRVDAQIRQVMGRLNQESIHQVSTSDLSNGGQNQ